MGVSGEFERVARLRARFARAVPGVALGIGDDAAVLVPSSGERLVWTIDEQLEGTHFELGWLTFGDVGYRAFMAAASDLAAMGARPWAALSALSLPSSLDEAAFDALCEGLAEAADAVGAPIVGGNLTRGPLGLTTTLLGAIDRPLTRAGARAGDKLWLAGAVGLAAAGLRALRNNVQHASIKPAVACWRRPRALIAEGLALRGRASAAIDVSDGLAQDLAHLCEASGLGAVLDADALLVAVGPSLVAAAEAVGDEPLGLALGGGEDYALLAASDEPVEGFSCVGELREGGGISLRKSGREEPLRAAGFDHFAE